MKTYNQLTLAGITLIAATACSSKEKPTPERPNIIYILADDLGYGDPSCMGQKNFSTPNIDKLASQGILFTDHYAGCSVSAPSRATLLTGLNTGHAPIRGNKELQGEGQVAMPEDTYTVMQLFKENGYTTGVFGKWGLGSPGSVSAPENVGVDTFFGYNCQRYAHSYFPHHLWDNDTKVMLEGNNGTGEGEYAPYLIHDKAMQFITDNSDQPFFMYYASVLPHAEMRLPEAEIAPFRGKYLPEVVYNGVDDGVKEGDYGTQTEGHAAFVAMVTLLDRQVGELMAHLEKLGIADNTIVIFTSDNGPHVEGGADPDYFDSNGALRGVKRDVYEGGIRVPFLVRWNGKIAPNTTTSHVSAFWDFLPTVADILDVEVANVDGISYLPTLLGNAKQQEEHPYLYWEFHEWHTRLAVRYGEWKGVIYNLSKGGELELYNLTTDIGETNNVVAEHPEIAAHIMQIMQNERTASTIFVNDVLDSKFTK